MQTHVFAVSRTARYCTLGSFSAAARTVWFVCHGYGQLAPYFIKKFTSLANDQTLVVAPEGLSRFYLAGFGGRIGATWMTKEERLTEIGDYVYYLDALYQHVMSQVHPEAQVRVLGFSQGVATVSRWLALGQPKAVAHLVLWAGLPPDDLEAAAVRQALQQTAVHLVYGQQDEFLEKVDFTTALQRIKEQGFDSSVTAFTGGHDIPETELLRLNTKLASLS